MCKITENAVVMEGEERNALGEMYWTVLSKKFLFPKAWSIFQDKEFWNNTFTSEPYKFNTNIFKRIGSGKHWMFRVTLFQHKPLLIFFHLILFTPDKRNSPKMYSSHSSVDGFIFLQICFNSRLCDHLVLDRYNPYVSSFRKYDSYITAKKERPGRFAEP